jgi:hypothetical protein
MSAQAQVCPVVGTTTNVLPPNHPTYDTSNLEARCPVTNAKVSHHDIIHNHPEASDVPSDPSSAQDASACPALKNANNKDSLTDATCPVVGPVSAYLPPSHPQLTEKEAGSVCPVTNATLEHHKKKVHEHPSVQSNASAEKCPVAGNQLKA